MQMLGTNTMTYQTMIEYKGGSNLIANNYSHNSIVCYNNVYFPAFRYAVYKPNTRYSLCWKSAYVVYNRAYMIVFFLNLHKVI